jgi:hypothetical protein
MTGGLIQLAAKGVQDIYITGNPQITFFTAIYKRHTNFSMEQIPQYFEGDIAFGRKIWCTLDRVGDLIHQMYLEIKLPSLNVTPNDNPDYHVSWTNSIGHSMIKSVEFEIGGQIIDRHYGQWLEIWSELTLPNSKKDGYHHMVGKHQAFEPDTQENALILYVPMQFWFCKNIGLALPLIALQHHEVRLSVTFRDFNECWVSSNFKPPGKGGLSSSAICNPCKNFNIDNITLYVDYIYLDVEERKMFAQNSHEYLIEQLQLNSLSITDKTDIDINLEFNHPVKELIWVFQSKNVATANNPVINQWFNFSDANDIDRPIDPLDCATFYIEGNERFKCRDAQYFRLLEPYYKHTAIPDNFIYTYSFAYKPEDYQPSGTLNFSRIDNPVLHIKLIEGLTEMYTNIYAINYNVLKIVSGMGGLLYTT